MHNNPLHGTRYRAPVTLGFGFHQHATRRALLVATIPPRYGIGAPARVDVFQVAGSDADQIANQCRHAADAFRRSGRHAADGLTALVCAVAHVQTVQRLDADAVRNGVVASCRKAGFPRPVAHNSCVRHWYLLSPAIS